MRPAADAMNQVLEAARNGPVAGTTPLGIDAARQAGCQIPHRLHLVRIERHYGDRTGIGLEHLRHPARQPRVTVEMALELDENSDAPADQAEKIAQGHHPVRGLLEAHEFEMGGRHGVQAAFSVGNPAERRVMIDHRLAVGSDVQVDFDRVVGVNGGRHGRRRVLDDAARLVVHAAMRDRPRDQPVEPGHNELLCGRATLLPYATSNEPSTSTAASSGSTATPTVVRAWRPLSAKAVTMRSEAPFITLGPSRKSGAELMKPPSRTTRTTLSRSPSAALTWARRLTAQVRAARWPSSTDTPAPSLPLAISFPSTSRQSWPDTTSRFPVRTKPT